MKKNRVSIWVAPEFKMKLKHAAIDQGLDMIEYTRRLTQPEFPDFQPIKRTNEKKFRIPF